MANCRPRPVPPVKARPWLLAKHFLKYPCPVIPASSTHRYYAPTVLHAYPRGKEHEEARTSCRTLRPGTLVAISAVGPGTPQTLAGPTDPSAFTPIGSVQKAVNSSWIGFEQAPLEMLHSLPRFDRARSPAVLLRGTESTTIIVPLNEHANNEEPRLLFYSSTRIHHDRGGN